jgi:hypothetical protein
MKRFGLLIVGLVALVSVSQASKFYWVHYGGPNMNCAIDSLVTGEWTNASSAPCSMGSTVKWLADRATAVGLGSGGLNAHAARLVELNPSVIAARYETITDQPYGDGDSWHEYLEGKGELDEYERSFLHWSEQTDVTVEPAQGTCFSIRYAAGDKVPMYFIPAFPTGQTPVDSAWVACCCSSNRVKRGVYTVNQFATSPTRFALCFADSVDANNDRARVRQLHKEWLCSEMQSQGQIGSSGEWFSGVFGDNCSWQWYNWATGGVSTSDQAGTQPRGGHVREKTSVSEMRFEGSSTFVGWHRGGRLEMLAALKDTFELGASWYDGDKAVRLELNVADSWSYPVGSNSIPWSGTEADLYMAELQFNVNAASVDIDAPINWYNAAQAIPLALTTNARRCSNGVFFPCSGGSNCLNYGQLVYGAYAFYRAVDSGDDMWGMQYFTSQGELFSGANHEPHECEPGHTGDLVFASDKRWDQKVWGAFIDKTNDTNASAYLGDPTGALVLHKSGTYGSGTAYQIYRRPFERGWVWVRVRDGSSIDSVTTRVLFDFDENSSGAPLQHIVLANGTISSNASSSVYLPAARALMTINQNAPDCCSKSWACCEEIDEP